MNIEIVSNLNLFPHLLADDLAEGFNAQVKVTPKATTGLKLVRHPECAGLSGLLKALYPLLLQETEDVSLQPGSLRLEVGANFNGTKVRLRTDSEALKERLKAELRPLGLFCSEEPLSLLTTNRLLCSHSDSSEVQLLAWLLNKQGFGAEIVVEEGLAANEVVLELADPDLAELPPRRRMPVVLYTDHAEKVDLLRERLHEHGFEQVRVQYLNPLRARTCSFELGSKWFDEGLAPDEVVELRELFGAFLREAGVDLDRYPVRFNREVDEGLEVVMTLPLGAAQDGSLRPYGLEFPQAYKIVVMTDDAEACAPLVESLNARKFCEVVVREDLDDDDRFEGFRIRCNPKVLPKTIFGLLNGCMADFLKHLGVQDDFEVSVYEWVIGSLVDGGDNELVLYVPIKGVQDGTLLAEMHSAARYDCTVFCEEPEEWTDVISRLEEFGFKDGPDVRPESVSSPQLKFGGAPKALVDQVVSAIAAYEPLEFRRRKAWDDRDDDIWIYLPKRKKSPVVAPALVHSEAGISQEQVEQSPAPCFKKTRRQYLTVRGGSLRLGVLRLPVNRGARHPLAPHLDEFEHFCLDSITAATLEHIAWCLQLGLPCLLEGPTSTSKTSSILYLASKLNRPVIRLNLNGQSDTGELVGHYAPAEGEDFWTWLDGVVVKAMQDGCWLVLDEVNLGEPQVLERLNAILERNGRLVLSERDSRVVEARPGFHLFATMNEAEYAGRLPLSPAFRDRWQGYRFVPAPGEREYAQMLRFLVTGKQPEVLSGRLRYRGARQEPCYPDLSSLDATLLDRVAQFHVLMEKACAGNGEGASLGAGRREGYVFTRRGLLTLLDFMRGYVAVYGGKASEGLGFALNKVYFDKLKDAEDLQLARQLLDAAGLGSCL